MLKGFLFPVNWSQKFIYAKFISPGSVLGYRIATVGWTEKTQISSEKQAHKFSGCQVTRQSPGHFQFHSEVSVAHYSLNLSISQFRGLTFNFKIKITYSWKSYYNLCQSPLKKYQMRLIYSWGCDIIFKDRHWQMVFSQGITQKWDSLIRIFFFYSYRLIKLILRILYIKSPKWVIFHSVCELKTLFLF